MRHKNDIPIIFPPLEHKENSSSSSAQKGKIYIHMHDRTIETIPTKKKNQRNVSKTIFKVRQKTLQKSNKFKIENKPFPEKLCWPEHVKKCEKKTKIAVKLSKKFKNQL